MMSDLYKPLPSAEWNFDDLPDDYLSIAFFYEFARDSQWIRAFMEEAGKSDPTGDRLTLEGTIAPLGGLSEEERSKIEERLKRRDDFLTKPFGSLVEGLANFREHFPQNNIRQLDGYGEDYFLAFVEGSFHPRLHVYATDEDGVLPNEEQPWFEELRIGYHENFVDLVLRVPANIRKEDLIQQFSEMVDEFWPSSRKKTFHQSSLYKGLDGQPLGFGKRSALQWLGVLRRFRACDNWTRFMELYPDAGADQDTKRKLREQRNKAEEILKWFDAGGEGQLQVTPRGKVTWLPPQ